MPRIDLLQFRGGTAANWTTENPILYLNEPGYETDTGRFKMGDGSTAWGNLEYRFESARPYVNLAAFPATGATRTIYIAEDTNLLYRWDGSAYVGVGGGASSGPAIAETYADIAARDTDEANREVGEIVKVTDASGDATVDEGYAYYAYEGSSVWRKLSEEESLDLEGSTIDPTPTDGSSNAVQSNGVYDALFNKVSKSGDIINGSLVINTSDFITSISNSGVSVSAVNDPNYECIVDYAVLASLDKTTGDYIAIGHSLDIDNMQKATLAFEKTDSRTYVSASHSNKTNHLLFPDKSGTLATLDDIPEGGFADATETTGTAVSFDVPKHYGVVTAETGNITFDHTNAKKGMRQWMRHNSGTKPTISSEAKLQAGQYEVGLDNYFEFYWISATRVNVTITQDITY